MCGDMGILLASARRGGTSRMALDLLKKSRWLAIASMLALASTTAVGCAAQPANPDEEGLDDGTGSSTDDITQVMKGMTAHQDQNIGRLPS